jgi:glycosyltransferase involved in cell wall biosynthesis
MILIDAIYLNSSGGKELLKLLIEKTIDLDIDAFFLLDKRLIDDYPNLKNTIFLNPNILSRHFFYLKNKNVFSSVLCFSNIPPTIRLNVNVYTYFHNILLLEKTGIIFNLKKLFIKFFKNNSNIWIVQTSSMKVAIKNKLFIKTNKILKLPFFKDFEFKNTEAYLKFKSKKFLYVSTGETHKNHFNLIKAFNKLSRQDPNASLTLTVPLHFTILCDFINESISKGSNIINKGFISKKILNIEYQKANIFIFPSLRESFGLGLIEAAQYELPIIASDLPYVFDVINPSHTFNPYNIDSIYDSMLNFDTKKFDKSQLKIKNKIYKLIKLLTTN